jgi:hypothetical protein
MTHAHRWRKADKPGPCEVCGAYTWALSTMDDRKHVRCMIHGPISTTTHCVVATHILSDMLKVALPPIRSKMVLLPYLK